MNHNDKVKPNDSTFVAYYSDCFAAISSCKSAALSAIGVGSKLLCLVIAMGLSFSYSAFAVDSYVTSSQNRSGVNDNCLFDISSTAASADLIAIGCNSQVTQASIKADIDSNHKAMALDKSSNKIVNSIKSRSKVVTESANSIASTDIVSGGQLIILHHDLGGAISALGYQINEVKDNANAGISAAMAMSAIPQSFLPGRSLVGGGITTYNGEDAVAIGLSTVSKSGQWVMKVHGTADTQGNTGGAVGAGFHF